MNPVVISVIAAALACAVPPVAGAQPVAQPIAQPEVQPGGQTGSGDRPSFRRITAPGDGHIGPRITIQIEPGDNFMTPDPEAEAAALAAAAEAARIAAEEDAENSGRDETPSDAPSAWFWSQVSPRLPGDLSRYWAVQELFGDPPPPEAQAVTPRLSHVAEIAQSHGRELLAATVGTQVSPAFALAVISVESAGRRTAVSHAGAQGLMQLIPATAERFGVGDVFDPAQNIRGGVAYLDWLMGEFDRDPVLVLAAYNAGEGAVHRSGGVPNYEETRNYVPRVLAAWQVARSLCLTPPELVSDGCVFRPIAAVP